MSINRETSTDLRLPQQTFDDDFILTISKVFSGVRWIGIVGSSRIKWKLYALILFCLFLAIEGQASKKVMRALAGVAVDISGHTEYSDWIGILTLFMSVIANIIWIFQDLLIILFSMGLSSRYRRLNECVEVMVAENNRNKNWSKVQRLQKQLIKNYVALTGMGFYNINRSVVLQMMGTIVTYVLVLVQYDASEG
ncbi:putative chemosensory receptor 5 [Danaus plexippus plexippus]|uniref:Chemosensory receptor 5 n=1 Tax=Danaus plexippus plexippus TaxID=278856 RepID=A0A212FKW9_DANPL|nr:putative chemosensory receptor 5 [Danaus plexippus plexippus]